MFTIKAEKLTLEAFAPFGSFYSMTDPDGLSLNGELHRFFPDRISVPFNTPAGFSVIMVKKPAEMKITQVEHHFTTPELIMPLNDDMIIHVSPASGAHPQTQLTKAFIVPKGTMVKINTAIWHLAPLPASANELNAMIVLPECTYALDCPVIDLSEEEQFIIEL